MPNVNRQLGQLRRMEREHAQMLRWVFLFWLLPGVFLVVGVWLEWHGLLLAILGFAVLSGIIQHAADVSRVRSIQQRAASLEASRDGGV